VDLELNDRLAIVTGGSRGKAIATELAKEGAKVAIVARDLAVAETAASDIAAKTGRPVYAYRADTGKDDDVRAAFSRIVAEHGRVDVLVNCAVQPAGQQPEPKLAGITDEVFWAYQRHSSRIFVLRKGGCPVHAASALRPYHQCFGSVSGRRTADRLDCRIDPQC
jgi:NAD(P)-dependent dehydrogenase (short-subunit alcohol dehydrogenase family)